MAKYKLCVQRAKRLGRSLPAQAEQNVQPECNINSDFALATTTLDYLERRGECNIPKRYLKEADWCEDGSLGEGYYIADPDDPSIVTFGLHSYADTSDCIVSFLTFPHIEALV